MSIPIETPPRDMTPEQRAWLHRLLIAVAGEFESMEIRIKTLEEKVEALESAP